MIEKIRIKEVASYDSSGIDINLGKINYIYGSNGTGKPTISEFLRNNESQKFSSCIIERIQGSSDFDLFVYNRNFVQENFNIRNEIKGIFTLGKESTDLLALIDEKIKDAEKQQERLGNLEKNIEEKEGKLRNLQEEFVDQCWDLKQNYDEVFEEAFTGLRNNKKRFMERCLGEAKKNNGDVYTYKELKNRVDSVFKNSREKIMRIPEIHYDSSLEKQSIFRTKIIGKNDIDIAKLISDLNISDWVQQGHIHMESTNGICMSILMKHTLNKYKIFIHP